MNSTEVLSKTYFSSFVVQNFLCIFGGQIDQQVQTSATSKYKQRGKENKAIIHHRPWKALSLDCALLILKYTTEDNFNNIFLASKTWNLSLATTSTFILILSSN